MPKKRDSDYIVCFGQRVCVLAHLIQRLCVLSDGRKERRRRVVAGRSG